MRLLSRLSRTRADSLAAALLATGAPLGLLAVRLVRGGSFSLAWLSGEIAGDPVTYLYVSVSTLAAFTLFGYALGREADGLVRLLNTDPLTGLHNRRALYERLEQECARTTRYGAPLSLLMIDLDGLKAINDRDGHRAGDAALRRVAEAIRSGSRVTDLGARWGGDEFALLAPNTDAEAAARLAERIRAFVSGGAGEETGGLLSVSVGVATLDPGTGSPSALVKTTDEALYAAKRAGRNRVAVR